MSLLEQITAHKRREVEQKKELFPVKLLEKSLFYPTPVVSLRKYLLREDKSGIIAEFKRHSPSRGPIHPYADVEYVSIGYMQAGASALSVLTDEHFFKGSNQDLQTAREFNFCPILRKDFILDEYQIVEARSIGADAVLLIAECLQKEAVKHLAAFARSLGLEVLLEVHSREQLDKWTPDIALVGVNNRNLQDFSVEVRTSFELLPHLPQEALPVSESGLNDPETVVDLQRAGFKGFLIGEHFMSQPDPPKACAAFIKAMRKIAAEKAIFPG